MRELTIVMLFFFTIITGCDFDYFDDEEDEKDYLYYQNSYFDNKGNGDDNVITGRNMIATIIFPEYRLDSSSGEIVIDIQVSTQKDAVIQVTFKDDGVKVEEGIQMKISSTFSDNDEKVEILETGYDGSVLIPLYSNVEGKLYVEGYFVEFPEQIALKFYVEYYILE